MKKLQILLVLSLSIFLFNTNAKAIENTPLRVVSLAPSITNTLIALGFEDNIIGISSYCEALPNGKDVPRLGIGKTFNSETVLMLKPDLVLGLDDLNIAYLPYHQIKTKSLEEILNSFIHIASLMEAEEKGQKLYKKSIDKITALKNEFAHAPSHTMLFVLSREADKDGIIYQITAAGNDGYFSELLNILHCENAVQSPIAYPILSFENLQAINPDIIIDIVAPELQKKLLIENWQQMPLKAVENNMVHMSQLGLVPGPKFLDFLDELAQIIRVSN